MVEDATTKHDDRRSPFIVSNIAHPQGKRNQCWECARPVCTAQRKTPRSLLINDNCTIKRKTLLSACLRMMGSTTKTMFFCAKFAQNKGKTLCSLLVFTQLFRTRNKERSIFSQFTQVSRSCTCAYLKKWPRYAPGTQMFPCFPARATFVADKGNWQKYTTWCLICLIPLRQSPKVQVILEKTLSLTQNSHLKTSKRLRNFFEHSNHDWKNVL